MCRVHQRENVSPSLRCLELKKHNCTALSHEADGCCSLSNNLWTSTGGAIERHCCSLLLSGYIADIENTIFCTVFVHLVSVKRKEDNSWSDNMFQTYVFAYIYIIDSDLKIPSEEPLLRMFCAASYSFSHWLKGFILLLMWWNINHPCKTFLAKHHEIQSAVLSACLKWYIFNSAPVPAPKAVPSLPVMLVSQEVMHGNLCPFSDVVVLHDQISFASQIKSKPHGGISFLWIKQEGFFFLRIYWNRKCVQALVNLRKVRQYLLFTALKYS